MKQLTNGTLLQGGKYRIVRFLSSGGFGNTYEGVHTMMDTRVAIKEFFPKMFCNRDENTSHVTVATQGNRELVDKLRKKFNEEAKAVFQMNHPNIVRVLDIFEENGTAYYVMEYIDGKSLNDITKERGALPEAEAVSYIRQVADALKYVHSLNRLHLDIKPGNIMIDKNGRAVLIDFGASKHYDMESGENTSTLMGVNTKGYAPIEQSTQSFTSFSPATDIYALGATLYKLLTGIVPPDANLLLAEEETLQPLPNSISAPTRNAVMAAMSLRRKDRPQSIDKLIEILPSIDECISKKREGTTTTNKMPSSKKDEETLFDYDNKSSNDIKKLQELTNAPATLCSTYPLPKKGTRKRSTTKKTSTTKVASKTAESKKTAKVKSEDTEYIGNTTTTTKEETEKISQPVAKETHNEEIGKPDPQANFEETKYEIPRTYKNFPIISERKSNEGDVEASLALAMMYLRGEGVRQNLDAAYQWIKKLDSQGDYRANILLSQWDSLKSKYEVKHQPEDNNRDDDEEVENNNSGTWKFLMGVVVAIGLIIVGFWQYFAYQEREKLRFEEEMEQSLNAIYYEDNILYVKGIQYEMIPVKGGTFMKGSHTENADIPEIVKETSVNDFSIGATEITEQIWYAVMDCSLDSIEGEFPMANISWEDCQLFIKKLNEVTNMNFRLPTEAEWEFAARGGTKSKDYLYSGSDNIDDVAWYGKNAKGLYWVAQKKPNELGLYDMSGNLYEYTSDLFYWNSNSKKNIYIPEDGTQIVIKGGCYNAVYDFICLPGYRMFSKKDSRLEDVGFRIAL